MCRWQEKSLLKLTAGRHVFVLYQAGERTVAPLRVGGVASGVLLYQPFDCSGVLLPSCINQPNFRAALCSFSERAYDGRMKFILFATRDLRGE